MPRPKQRTPELRAQIVASAMAALADDGVEGFTTRAVARRAQTSGAAIYELFEDRAGLLRELFFEGFRRLGEQLEQLPVSASAAADLGDLLFALRSFAGENPVLTELMFSRPFSDFRPGADELAAGQTTREFIVGRVRRCVDAGLVAGDVTDVAHVFLALAQGLALQETSGWLGSSPASRTRRWQCALDLLTGQ